jgi:glucokinase
VDTIVDGFTEIQSHLPYPPVATSFAFHSRAEYPLEIIGDLQNLPAFRRGIALGPLLHERFNLLVFMNSDGDLFAYSEALAGFFPHMNALLEESRSPNALDRK